MPRPACTRWQVVAVLWTACYRCSPSHCVLHGNWRRLSVRIVLAYREHSFAHSRLDPLKGLGPTISLLSLVSRPLVRVSSFGVLHGSWRRLSVRIVLSYCEYSFAHSRLDPSKGLGPRIAIPPAVHSSSLVCVSYSLGFELQATLLPPSHCGWITRFVRRNSLMRRLSVTCSQALCLAQHAPVGR